MKNQDDIRNMLKQGIEAARVGDTDTARDLFLQVTDADMNNERAWLWLANIADDPDEQRVYLANVLQINPSNERAQKMMNRLEGKDKASAAKDEIIPGVPRQQAIILGGAVGGAYLVIMIILLVVGSGRRSSFYGQQTQEAQQVAAVETQAAQQETEVFLLEMSITETQAALIAQTASPTPTERPNTLPTLPPTWTPTAEPEDAANGGTGSNGGGMAVTPLAPPPADQLVDNIIVGYGGPDRLSVGFYEMIGVQLDNIGQIQTIGTNLVNNVTIDKSNGRVLVYTRYYPNTFDFGLERGGFSGAEGQRLADAWEPLDFILEQQDAHYSLDGTKIVFIAPILDTNSNEIWLLDLAAQPAPNQSPLRRMTNDNADYSNPSVSPDNTRILAVKYDSEGLVAESDIVAIQIDGGAQAEITRDGNANIESFPRWSPDGTEIVYAASQNMPDAQNDIIRLNVANPSAPARFVARNPEWDEKNPVYSPDGRYVAYASNQTGEYNIFIHEIETGAVYQVTNSADQSYFPNDWYQPGVVPERPVISPLPTPLVVSEENN